jgi:hypothetical protein
MNVRRSHPVRTCGIGAGLDCLDLVNAVIIRLNADTTDEVWVKRRSVGVVDVNVAAARS